MSKATVFWYMAKLTNNPTLRKKYLANYHRFQNRKWNKEWAVMGDQWNQQA